MRTTIIIAVASLIMLLFACTDKNTNPGIQEAEKIIKINHRHFKGECVGYCNTKLIIDSSQIKYIQDGWDNSGDLPTIESTFETKSHVWNQIVNIIVLDDIMQLDSEYLYDDEGSPVSEGYVEFEIYTSNREKKVKFNDMKYLEPLDSLNKLLILLRVDL